MGDARLFRRRLRADMTRALAIIMRAAFSMLLPPRASEKASDMRISARLSLVDE